MKHLSRRFRLVVVGVGLLCVSSVADAATIKVRAVRLNGVALPSPAASIDANQGDLIEVDLLASGWGTAFATVKTFQATINNEVMIDQELPTRCGSIKPINFDTLALRPTGTFFNINSANRGVCSAGSANAGESCVSTAVACTGGVCVDGMCDGGTRAGQLCATAENQCTGGTCIDRADFIFDGFVNPICAVSTFATNYPLGCTLFLEDGPTDGGGDYYMGTVLLEVGADAKGTFVFDILLAPASFLTDPDRNDAPLESEALTINLGGTCALTGACCVAFSECQDLFESGDEGACAELGGVFLGQGTTCNSAPAEFCSCPSIVDSFPANCEVDARYPHAPGETLANRIGFESVEVTLSAGTEMSLLNLSSFQLTHVGGGAFNPPEVSAITPLGGTSVRLDFNRPFMPQRWTCWSLTCNPVGTKDVCWGHLPGDVDGGCASNAPDVLVLIDFLNSQGTLEWYQCDVDDSGVCNPADVLAVIDLLNGASGFQNFNNATCSGGACPTAAP